MLKEEEEAATKKEEEMKKREGWKDEKILELRMRRVPVDETMLSALDKERKESESLRDQLEAMKALGTKYIRLFIKSDNELLDSKYIMEKMLEENSRLKTENTRLLTAMESVMAEAISLAEETGPAVGTPLRKIIDICKDNGF
jgi:hypothetical protein